MVKYKKPYRDSHAHRKQGQFRSRFSTAAPMLSKWVIPAAAGLAAGITDYKIKQKRIDIKRSKLTTKSTKKAKTGVDIIKKAIHEQLLVDAKENQADEEKAELENGIEQVRADGVKDLVAYLKNDIEIQVLENDIKRLENGKIPHAITIGALSFFAAYALISMLIRSSKKLPESKTEKIEEVADEQKTPAAPAKKPKISPRERISTPVSIKREKKKKSKTRVTQGELAAAIEDVFMEYAEPVSEILIELRDKGVIKEKSLRKVMKEPTQIKGIMKWKRDSLEPIFDEKGLDFEEISNGNNGETTPVPERDSDPGDPDYVSTEDALKELGLSSAWGNKPGEVHRALRKNGFDIIPASGGHLKVIYKGDVVKDQDGKPLMVVKTSTGTEIPPGTMKNIAKSCYRAKKD